ncbi:forkhead domain-containing protein [Ditylenchus destructor]|uniref:Forkhead domain-containing protein n=1 Tax=Ditylenchus destructor TaxID=166010 RepID=A0AAD4N7R6_9BILA|nr:forkhead domain-containing protein [Ditylenchus destructor]
MAEVVALPIEDSKRSPATSPLLAEMATSFQSMRDPSDEKEERPSLSYKDLIIEAIESSPEKRLKLSEIYQVIRYLHPYYSKRADQWGWQNSIRHNLSLHDCFIKLPLKQTSASGVVGHYWTVVRDAEEKHGSSRRRSRAATKHSKHGPAGDKPGRRSPKSSNNNNSNLKGPKDRQSVSSDSGVMSGEESHSNSPTSSGSATIAAIVSASQACNPYEPTTSCSSNTFGLDNILPIACSASLLTSFQQQHQNYMQSNAIPTSFAPLPGPQPTMDPIALAKNQLLSDLLNTTTIATPPVTSAPSFSQPPSRLHSALLGSNGSMDGILGEVLGLAGALPQPTANPLAQTVANEIQRLQLLNLYLYQQGLLQQILLDGGVAPNPLPGLLGELMASPPAANDVQLPLLTQILLAKLSAPSYPLKPALSTLASTPTSSLAESLQNCMSTSLTNTLTTQISAAINHQAALDSFSHTPRIQDHTSLASLLVNPTILMESGNDANNNSSNNFGTASQNANPALDSNRTDGMVPPTNA